MPCGAQDDDEPAAASRAEVDSLTARLRQAARRSSALVHGPGGDGGAAAAAAAERVRLSRAVESGGAEALQMIGLKVGLPGAWRCAHRRPCWTKAGIVCQKTRELENGGVARPCV